MSKIAKTRKIGLLRRPVAQPRNGISKICVSNLFRLSPSTARNRKYFPSSSYLFRRPRQKFSKNFLWGRVYSGGQCPSTLHSTPSVWFNLWLDLILQLDSVLGCISPFNPSEQAHENFGPNFFSKISQVWGVISPKRGRNSKFCLRSF